MQRKQRLRRREDFDTVYHRGRSWANNLLALRALPNGLDESRFGFSISKRVGNAVVRNRAKRRLREIVRALAIPSGWDAVLIARPPAGAADFQQLSGAVRSLCDHARLRKPPPSQPTHDNRRGPDGV